MTSVFSSFRDLFLPKHHRFDDIERQDAPEHVAFIMDGNGRWAKKRGLPRLAGHRAGARAVREIVEAAPSLGIKFITLYTFSAENWRRPKDEVGGLMRLFEEMLQAELDELDQNNVKIKVIGDLKSVGASTRLQFERAMERTINNSGLTLIIALNYSGRADIIEAVNKLTLAVDAGDQKAGAVDETIFAEYLSTRGIPDPALVVRSSGEMRLSNFLLWESAYSEFWVTDTLWPDFTKDNLIEAIGDYQRRERRFGGFASGDEGRGQS